MAVLAGKLAARRKNCAPVTGNRRSIGSQWAPMSPRPITRSATIRRRSKRRLSICSSMRTSSASADHSRSRRHRRPAARPSEMLWGERRGNGTIVAAIEPTRCPMPQANDLSRCLTALDQDSTLIAVIEMSQSSWLVAGIVLGIERHPAKKLEANEAGLLRLLQPHGTSPWAKGSRRAEAERSGRRISRIAVAFEAGRDGVWLARWLRARDVDAQACPGAGVLSREFSEGFGGSLIIEASQRGAIVIGDEGVEIGVAFGMVDARQLEPPASRRCQGRVDPGRGQPALCRHLARPQRA
jgi:hypothetical protein